jgi:hypothetical protein
MSGMVGTPDLRAEIEAAVVSGKGVDEISEELLDTEAIEDESRDALWLYAWGCSERYEDGLFQPHFVGVGAEHD